MKFLFIPLVLPCFATAICLRFFTPKDGRKVEYKPGYIWYWNANTSEFDKLEALTLGSTAFCNINAVSELRGKTLIAGFDPISPFIIQNADKTGLTGFIGDIWTILEEVLGFKTIYRRARRQYQRLLRNEEVDALLIVSTVYEYASSYFDYSLSFTTNSYALFVQSEGERASRRLYLDTFSSNLWLTTFIFVLCIVGSIMGTYHVKKLICVNYTEFHDELSSPFFSLFYVLGGISGQGFQKIPRSWSLRLIFLSCLILGVLLTCGFSSTLTSDLANKKDSLPFTNLEDVTMKRTHTLCVRNGSSAYIHFTVDESQDGEIKDNWKGLLNLGCPDITSNQIVELCDPSFVYLEAPNIFRSVYYKVQRNCNFVQLPDSYWDRKLSFLHARSAEHRHLINKYILRMGTAGILNYLERKWMSTDIYDESSYLRRNNFQPVEYEHIHMVFYVFFMMVILSGIICILENVWYKLRLKRKKINPTWILPRTRDYVNTNLSKVYRKSRPRTVGVRQCRIVRSILSPEIMKSPEFLQNVTIRMNRW